MREKGEQSNNSHFAYFSQFRSTPRDGFASPDSDFRPIEELMRYRIKPAWYHYFNFSKVRWRASRCAFVCF